MELMTYILLVIFKFSASNVDLEIFYERKNWFEAKSECGIRGRRLADPDELHPNTCDNKSLNIWLNEFSNERLTPWIANMGCFNVQKDKLPKPSLLDCYQSCETTPFGYNTHWCSCEDTTTVGFISPSSCLSGNNDALWFYNSMQIDLSDDDYTMDCITAQCTDNGTIYKAVNCSSKEFAKCQRLDSSFITAEINTQANSESICYGQAAHLTSKQMCTPLGKDERNTSEFWTGIKRYRYNITERNDVDKKEVQNSDILSCVYVRCPIGSATEKYTKNCRHKQDGFACIFNGTSDNITTVKTSPESSLASSLISVSLASSFYIEATSATLKLLTGHASKNAVSSSINKRSISVLTYNNDRSTTAYSTSITKVPEFNENRTIHSTPTRDSNSKSYNHNTDIPANVPPTSTVETSMWMKNSVLMHTQSKIENSILQTSVTSELINIHSSKHVEALTADMTTTVFSSVVINQSGTNSNESNKMYNTTTRNQNNIPRGQQLSTGLIVGVSVSILCLVVLIIGVFGICRLRNQRALKERSLDFPTPINTMNTPNYHDINIDPKKETKVIENDQTHPVVSAKDDDMSFRLTDNTSNGKTNKPNDAYAVVVMKPVTNKPDNTSNGKTTKSNNAHDAYAVVVKIPGKNQDKHEKTSLDIPEINDSMNQPRPLSGNESGNIYDTSIVHRDCSDPTYNTTTHVHARERANESDYDHF